MNKLLCLLFIVACWSCAEKAGTEKHQDKRDNITDVRDKVKEITTGDILIGRDAKVYTVNDYLIICDFRSNDQLIHLFGNKNFNYLTSTAYKGEGPNEISNIGGLAVNEADQYFYAFDHGKQKIFGYHLPELLGNPSYTPIVKTDMEIKQFPIEFHYINDTLSIALIIMPTGEYGFNEAVAKWNMNTGEITKREYTHPEIEKKRVSFAASEENDICVECYHHHDLITICNLDGDLKYNIYGPKWNNQKTNKVRFYGDVVICKNRIITSFSAGRDNFGKDYQPTAFLVFDLEGNYLQTLETGYNISTFCYDKKYNRLIMSLNDDYQFAYLDLDGIIK